MAKDLEAPSQMLSISPEALQAMLKTVVVEAAKAFTEEQRRPSETDIRRAAKRKQEWQEIERQNKEHERLLQQYCTHIHPSENKSTVFRFQNSYPNGAWTLICGRCFKTFQNYIGMALIRNEEFNKWWTYPSLVNREG